MYRDLWRCKQCKNCLLALRDSRKSCLPCSIPDMYIYECLITLFLLFKQKNCGTFRFTGFIIHYSVCQELKINPIYSVLFTSAPHFCQMRQGSYPGCCLPPRVVLFEQSGSLDLVHGFWQKDSGPFIEKSHYTAMEEGEWNARCTNSFAAWP